MNEKVNIEHHRHIAQQIYHARCDSCYAMASTEEKEAFAFLLKIKPIDEVSLQLLRDVPKWN